MKDRLGQRLLEARIRAVLPWLRGRVLDVGCGTNAVLAAYRASAAGKRAGSSLGVDVYPWEGVDLVVEDTAHLPFADASFDTATVIAALNHIPNRGEVLGEIGRVLVPGGRFVMTMIPPGISRLWHLLRSPWDVDQAERGVTEGEVWGITRASILALLQETGYEIEAEQGFMLGINRLTVARRVDGESGADSSSRSPAR